MNHESKSNKNSPPRLAFLLRRAVHQPIDYVIVIGYILLGIMFGFEIWWIERLPVISIYYWLPIFLLAWFIGRRQATIAVILATIVSFVILLWKASISSYSIVIWIGRAATFLAAYFLLKPIVTARMMLEIYLGSDTWEALRPFTRVGKCFVIFTVLEDGSWENDNELSPSEIPILIQRGKTFGNASHPTTRMCLTLMEEHLKPGDSVFDIGSGTGILAIAAAKLGASRVLAVDIDPESENVIPHNISLNKVADIVEYRPGSLEIIRGDSSYHSLTNKKPDKEEDEGVLVSGWQQFDLVLANILTTTLIDLFSKGLAQTLRPQGTLILSGIRKDEVQKIRPAMQTAELHIVETQHQKDWVALVVRHSS